MSSRVCLLRRALLYNTLEFTPGDEMTRNRGFSLTEIIVTIAIVALLITVVLPMLNGAIRNATANKMRADLNALAVALETYKADHGDYPRLPAFYGQKGPEDRDLGARLLARALLGSYLTGDEFRVIDQTGNGAVVLADRNGNPILYYPAHPVRYDLRSRHGYVASYIPAFGRETQTNEQLRRASLFNAYDNDTISKVELMNLLGAETNGTNLGGIGGGRLTPKYSGAYLLLAAGPDGQFGTEDDLVLVGGGQPAVPQMTGTMLAGRDDTPEYAVATNFLTWQEQLGQLDGQTGAPPAWESAPDPVWQSPEIPTPRPVTPPADALNVIDFGATPNDGTDDTVAIRKAIEEAAKQGKALVFPEGEFRISQTVEVREGGSYYGPGIIRWTGGGGAAFKVPGDANNILINGLTFVGRGIWFNNKHNNVTIINNVFRDIRGGSQMEGSGVFANGGLTNSLIQNNQFFNVSRDGVWINTTAGGTIIDSNYFDTVHEAIHVWSNYGTDIKFTNNVGVRLERMGIEFQGYDGHNSIVANNTFTDWRKELVYHDSFALSIMNKGSNIKVVDNQLSGYGNNPVGIEFAGHNGVVSGNIVTGFREGMHVTWGHNIQITGNHFTGQTWMSIWFPGYEAFGVHNARVSGNKFTYPANAIVFMGSGANGTVIEGNEALLSGGADFVQAHGGNAVAGVTIGQNTIIRN